MTEKTINKFAAAFIAAQSQMGDAKKDSTNPFFKNKYADLNSVREACVPALNANGIAVLQPIVQVDGKNFVKTLLLHESGESMECLTEILFAKQNDPQAQGSGITYARRYGLQSLVTIGAEDDDGNKAAEAAKSEPKKEPAKNAFGLPKGLVKEIDEDKQDMHCQKNEEEFDVIKLAITGLGSLSELQAAWEGKKKEIASLSKYAPDLFAEINAVKEREKKLLMGE